MECRVWQKSRFPTLRERFANGIDPLHALSQRLVTDGLVTGGEKRFCSGIFCRISVLWRKKGPAARSSDLLPIFGKLVEIHLLHPQIIEKFQQKLVYP
ncbi:hypothetical protein [Microcoleus vaginatus]|uniref:hypothetical protein n=1 Tax=Microcoleus vaginatus TaxID=119532 RepID=UPI001683EFF3|nr:hypothetical protein [Microcoleus sp. FACHB-84]